MRLLTGLATLALVAAAAGCLGASGPAAWRSEPGSSAAGGSRLTISYWLGAPARSAAKVTAPCPALARCSLRRVAGVRPREWGRFVVRRLACSPARGGYAHPKQACRTLRGYARLLHRKRGACSCPAMLIPAGHAAGILDGRRLSLSVDYCSACGAGPRAAADVELLLGGT